MITKTHRTLSGSLMHPLCVGSCAFIRHESGYTRTSRVVAIKSVSREEICFETQNTHYRLVPEPTTECADGLTVMGLTA